LGADEASRAARAQAHAQALRTTTTLHRRRHADLPLNLIFHNEDEPMENQTGAGDSATRSDVVERSAGGDGPLTAREAARSLIDTRRKDPAGERRDDDENSGEARDGGTAETRSADEAGAAQEADEATGPGETRGDDQGAERHPSIEPPRSWTKEDKELFRSLPRETQERLAERERSREADFLRRQNEAAEKSKGLTAKEQAAEQLRTQYEHALPQLLQALHQQHLGEFADIKTIGDLDRLAREDGPRYVMWDAQQRRIAAIQQHVQAAQVRQALERAASLQAFMRDESTMLLERAPDLADAKIMAEAQKGAIAMLNDLGFKEDELRRLWHGEAEISLHDHRLQLILRDGVKYREAQAKARAALERPVPHVQRPGPAPARDADADEKIRSLDDRLTTSGNLRDAAALLVAQRQARARR
jgi:hypothetical protein